MRKNHYVSESTLQIAGKKCERGLRNRFLVWKAKGNNEHDVDKETSRGRSIRKYFQWEPWKIFKHGINNIHLSFKKISCYMENTIRAQLWNIFHSLGFLHMMEKVPIDSHKPIYFRFHINKSNLREKPINYFQFFFF